MVVLRVQFLELLLAMTTEGKKEGGAVGEVDFTDIVGGNGRFQMAIFIFCFACSAPHCFHNLIMTFFAPEFDHWCARPHEVIAADISAEEWKNQSLPWVKGRSGVMERSKCSMYPSSVVNGSLFVHSNLGLVKCIAWEYDHSFYKDTMVDQWDLVCDREWLISISKTVYMVAFLIAATISGQMSDRFGRRTVTIVCLFLFLTAGLLTLLSTNFLVFLSLRFFVAVGMTSIYTISYVIIAEVVSVQYRSTYLFTFKYGWTVAYMLMPYIAWLVPAWFWLQVAFTVPFLLLLCVFWVVPETPRWLLTHGKLAEAERVLLMAAEKNGKDMEQAKLDIQNYLANLPPKLEEENGNETVLDLLKTPALRKSTLNVYFCWFIISYIYYALSWNTNDLGGDPYWTFFVMGAVEFPAGLTFMFLCRVTGHRLGLLISNVSAGLCLIAVVFVPTEMHWLMITLVMLGKFFNSASFDIVYIYTAEIFPTVVRNVAVGSSSTFARVGAMLAPFIRQMADLTHPLVPAVVPGGLSIISGILMLLLPETKGQKIPDTIEEGELFSRRDKTSAIATEKNGCNNGVEMKER